MLRVAVPVLTAQVLVGHLMRGILKEVLQACSMSKKLSMHLNSLIVK